MIFEWLSIGFNLISVSISKGSAISLTRLFISDKILLALLNDFLHYRHRDSLNVLLKAHRQTLSMTIKILQIKALQAAY